MIQNIEKFLYHGSFYDNIDLSKAEYKECLFLTPNIRYALTYSGVDDDFGVMVLVTVVVLVTVCLAAIIQLPFLHCEWRCLYTSFLPHC